MTTVLIADDNRKNLYLLETILKGSGYVVVTAGNGAEALAAARQSPPDAIITDILMPVMDGFELCRQWKADPRLHTVPFIFYTATYIDPKDEKFALGLGAERFILKPQKPDVLTKELRDVLSESAKRRQSSPAGPLDDEMEVLRQYNEVLFRKLEKKMTELENEIETRKTLQQEREAVIRELELKNAELARFTYTVSHELRSPLITIRGYSGILDEDVTRGCRDPEALHGVTRRISAAVDTLEALLSDLLKLSRAGQSVGEKQPENIRTIAEEAQNIFAGTLAERGIRLEIAPNLPVVPVDHTRMREVFVNLIDNSIKFMGTQSEPVISIGVQTEEGIPVFFVRDNGIGIAPQYLERIFNLFEKLDPGIPGTGIGLSIVRRIIEGHGGKIRAESGGPGKGTTFWFTLQDKKIVDTHNNNKS